LENDQNKEEPTLTFGLLFLSSLFSTFGGAKGQSFKRLEEASGCILVASKTATRRHYEVDIGCNDCGSGNRFMPTSLSIHQFSG